MIENHVPTLVEGTNGRYIIYPDGRVWSNCYKKFLTPQVNSHGYQWVSLRVDGKRVPKQIHRLLAETFIPNPENKPCVNHKNGQKLDVRLDNLEWATYAENCLHAYRTGLRKPSPEAVRSSKAACSKAVMAIKNGEQLNFPSVTDAANYFGIKRRTLSKALERGTKSGGIIWAWNNTHLA